MFTEFYSTYKEAFKWTCSAFIFLLFCWILAINDYLHICHILEPLLLYLKNYSAVGSRKGINTNITNELSKNPKVNSCELAYNFLDS